MSETVTVCGEPMPCRGQSLAELLAEHGIEPGRRGIAVAVNACVIPRGEWSTTRPWRCLQRLQN